MRQSLKESLDVNIHDAGELLESLGGNHVSGTPALWLIAAGTALGRTARASKNRLTWHLQDRRKNIILLRFLQSEQLWLQLDFLEK